ncbi:MAG: hypothetical protein ACAI44_38610 [Candidatus Sericytochromatia bacterium]
MSQVMNKVMKPPVLKVLGLTLILGLPGCVVRNPLPDEKPTASYRVVLVNRTSQDISYRYTRYLPPEARIPPMPTDPQADPQLAETLSISFSFDELKPGATALLDVIPGSSLSLSYMAQGKEQREERRLDTPMQLSVSESGITKAGPSPSP